jgi:hypothetical protein
MGEGLALLRAKHGADWQSRVTRRLFNRYSRATLWGSELPMHTEMTPNNGTSNPPRSSSDDGSGFESRAVPDGAVPDANASERGRNEGAVQGAPFRREIDSAGEPVAVPSVPLPEVGDGIVQQEVASEMAPALALSLRASLRASLESLSSSDLDRDVAIHAVRKNNKSTIATFWLLKPWVNAESFERARSLVRESSRLLQRPRRAVALLRTLEDLSKAEAPPAPPALEENLASDRRIPDEVFAEVKRLLADALDEIASWPGARVADEEVLSRFQKTRRRTLRKTRAARRKASPHRLHSLRKEVKRHTALHHALAPFVEHPTGTKHLDALAERLGNVNDLEDLRDEVRSTNKDGAEGELNLLDRRARRRQQKEIKGSLKLARKVLKKVPAKTH